MESDKRPQPTDQAIPESGDSSRSTEDQGKDISQESPSDQSDKCEKADEIESNGNKSSGTAEETGSPEDKPQVREEEEEQNKQGPDQEISTCKDEGQTASDNSSEDKPKACTQTPAESFQPSQKQPTPGSNNIVPGLDMPNSILRGRDEDSIVAAQLMTSLARGDLSFDHQHQMSPQSNSACNLIVNSHQILDQSNVQSLEQLDNGDESYIPNVRYRSSACDAVYQSLGTLYNTEQNSAGSSMLNNTLPSNGYLPMDNYADSATGQWLQGEHRQRNGYHNMDMTGYGSHPHNLPAAVPHFQQSTPADGWTGQIPGFNGHATHMIPNPIRAHSNYPCGIQNLQNMPGLGQEQMCFNDQMVSLSGMGDRSNNHSGNNYNSSNMGQLQDLSCNASIPFDIEQPGHLVDYSSVQKQPPLTPMSEIAPVANSNDTRALPENTSGVYQSFQSNESVGKRSFEAEPTSNDRHPNMGPKRRKKSRSSRGSSGVGYVDLMKNLFYTPHSNPDAKSATAEDFEYNIQEVETRNESSREGFYMVVSPDINPGEVDAIDHKGLIAKYIDYLLIENEQITEMSKSVSIPIENCVMDDPYLMDIIKVKIPFPTPKYLHWLRTYYPTICVDWGAIDKELAQYLPMGNGRKRRAYFIDNRPSPLLLGESFYFFQREKDRRNAA